jgi:hypothetical protein
MNITRGAFEFNDGFCSIIILLPETNYGSYSLLQINLTFWEIGNFWIDRPGKFVAL